MITNAFHMPKRRSARSQGRHSSRHFLPPFSSSSSSPAVPSLTEYDFRRAAGVSEAMGGAELLLRHGDDDSARAVAGEVVRGRRAVVGCSGWVEDAPHAARRRVLAQDLPTHTRVCVCV